jgi:hypothetical protein
VQVPIPSQVSVCGRTFPRLRRRLRACLVPVKPCFEPSCPAQAEVILPALEHRHYRSRRPCSLLCPALLGVKQPELLLLDEHVGGRTLVVLSGGELLCLPENAFGFSQPAGLDKRGSSFREKCGPS